MYLSVIYTIISLKFFGFILYVRVFCLLVCVCLCTTCVPGVHDVGVGAPGAGLKDGYKLPCGCSELNLGPLEKEQCS